MRKERESKAADPLNRTAAINCQDICHDPLKDRETGVEKRRAPSFVWGTDPASEAQPEAHCTDKCTSGGGFLGSTATQITFQEAEHRVRKQQDRPDSSHSDVSLFPVLLVVKDTPGNSNCHSNTRESI